MFMQADLLGVMVWWNVQLNAVSLVNLVMVRSLLVLPFSCMGRQTGNRVQRCSAHASHQRHRSTL